MNYKVVKGELMATITLEGTDQEALELYAAMRELNEILKANQ